MSTYQMLILLQFNENDKLSTLEMQQRTNIPMADLKRNLVPLLNSKKQILKKVPERPSIEDKDEFCVNEAFTSKQVKV